MDNSQSHSRNTENTHVAGLSLQHENSNSLAHLSPAPGPNPANINLMLPQPFTWPPISAPQLR